MAKVPGMVESWYPTAEGNQNENDLKENITPFGVVTGRIFNPPMFFPEFKTKQLIRNKPKIQETILRLTPTEIRLKDENEIPDQRPTFVLSLVNDGIRSVPLFRGMQNIVPVQDRNIELKLFPLQSVKKITVDGVEFTEEEVTILDMITGSQKFNVEVFNSLDELVESFSVLIYELSA